MTHKIDFEAKTRPGEPYTYKKVKCNRRTYGEIRTYTRGGKKLNIYWAERDTDEKFHADNTWAIDVDTILALRPYGISYVGVLIEDGTKLLAPISLFAMTPENKEKGVTIRNYEKHVGAKGKLGAKQFYVPESLFARVEPPEEERVATLVGRMRIAKSRGR